MQLFWILLAASHIALSVDAASPPKKEKATKPEFEGILEPGCRGCFPGSRKTCDKELWGRCCSQEIGCHHYSCRGEVMGHLQAKQKVRALVDFDSDDEEKAKLPKGLNGRILEVDKDGDAYIKFWKDGFESEADADDFLFHWVFKESFWDKLQLSGNTVRLRALKTVNCLNNCTNVFQCVPFPEMSKKKQKKYGACMGDCKLQECQQDEECKTYMEGYHNCKMDISKTQKCNPVVEL